MNDLIKEIALANKHEIDELLKAVLHRYSVLFPEWEVSTLSLQKESNRNRQLDSIIAMLQKMKSPNNCPD